LPERQSFVRLLSKFDINYTELHSKDNAAATQEDPQAYYQYVEEADALGLRRGRLSQQS
jgi:hypothetical protein